jgi:formyl-CoA transferase
MGKPELADDPKYATHISRGENTEELDALIGDWSRTWEMKDLINHLIEEEVPHGLVYTAKDMIADPHIQARESIINVDVPGVGEFPMQNIFPFFSDTKPSIRWSGPAHGEHTDEVYGDLLGYDAAKLAELRSKGIIK